MELPPPKRPRFGLGLVVPAAVFVFAAPDPVVPMVAPPE
jgi:hypothetical protein